MAETIKNGQGGPEINPKEIMEGAPLSTGISRSPEERYNAALANIRSAEKALKHATTQKQLDRAKKDLEKHVSALRVAKADYAAGRQDFGGDIIRTALRRDKKRQIENETKTPEETVVEPKTDEQGELEESPETTDIKSEKIFARFEKRLPRLEKDMVDVEMYLEKTSKKFDSVINNYAKARESSKLDFLGRPRIQNFEEQKKALLKEWRNLKKDVGESLAYSESLIKTFNSGDRSPEFAEEIDEAGDITIAEVELDAFEKKFTRWFDDISKLIDDSNKIEPAAKKAGNRKVESGRVGSKGKEPRTPKSPEAAELSRETQGAASKESAIDKDEIFSEFSKLDVVDFLKDTSDAIEEIDTRIKAITSEDETFITFLKDWESFNSTELQSRLVELGKLKASFDSGDRSDELATKIDNFSDYFELTGEKFDALEDRLSDIEDNEPPLEFKEVLSETDKKLNAIRLEQAKKLGLVPKDSEELKSADGRPITDEEIINTYHDKVIEIEAKIDAGQFRDTEVVEWLDEAIKIFLLKNKSTALLENLSNAQIIELTERYKNTGTVREPDSEEPAKSPAAPPEQAAATPTHTTTPSPETHAGHATSKSHKTEGEGHTSRSSHQEEDHQEESAESTPRPKSRAGQFVEFIKTIASAEEREAAIEATNNWYDKQINTAKEAIKSAKAELKKAKKKRDTAAAEEARQKIKHSKEEVKRWQAELRVFKLLLKKNGIAATRALPKEEFLWAFKPWMWSKKPPLRADRRRELFESAQKKYWAFQENRKPVEVEFLDPKPAKNADLIQKLMLVMAKNDPDHRGMNITDPKIAAELLDLKANGKKQKNIATTISKIQKLSPEARERLRQGLLQGRLGAKSFEEAITKSKSTR